jgi:hypothetical protein
VAHALERAAPAIVPTQGCRASSLRSHECERGSAACRSCHAQIYERWRKTSTANVVRDPRQSPEAIIPNFSKPDPLVKFTLTDLLWCMAACRSKRYFTKIGDDYFVLPAQQDVTQNIWRPFMVANGDGLATLSPDNMKRPTRALCDACHSVHFDIHTKKHSQGRLRNPIEGKY